MTDPLDELMELKPTHASALLIDPVDRAERAQRSARGARRRANVLLTAMSVAALALVVALGALFLRPTEAMPATTPSAVVSGIPVIKGSIAVAPYTAERAADALIIGGAQPDKICLGDYTPGGTCTYAVKLSGLDWAMVPWRETVGTTSYARGFLSGTYDGTTFTARTVTDSSAIEVGPPAVSPAAASAKSLITCDVTVNADSSNGLGNEPLAFPGLEAYWVDMDAKTYMVATSGDLGVAVTAAKLDGVIDAEVSVLPSGASIQVSVLANVPGLRERIAEVAGTSIPMGIVPAFYVVP